MSDSAVENIQGTGPASSLPRRIGPPRWLGQRDTSLLFRLRLLVWAAFGALIVSGAVAVWRAPRDPLALAMLLATAVLGAALVARHALEQQLTRRMSDRQAGEAQILQGLSRSVSADAIVDAIVNALRRSADADHVVVARLRPVERVVETMLVSTRAMISTLALCVGGECPRA